MKIGIISDIHSNIYGLKSVLRDMGKVDAILCAGDIAGYYTFINEVVEELRKLENFTSVLGNHDAHLLKLIPDAQNKIVMECVEYARKIITPENLEYLKKIKSASISLDMDGLKIKIWHGSPFDEFRGYVYPDEDLSAFKDIDADIIILGQTHMPMIKNLDGKVVVNPGSCGQPRDNDKRASYAVLDTKTKQVSINRVEFDISKVCQAVKEAGLSEELIKILSK